MSSFLRVSSALVFAVPVAVAALAACGDDVTETPTTTTTTSGTGGGGTGGTVVTGGGGTGGTVVTGGGGTGGTSTGGSGGGGGGWTVIPDSGADVCPGDSYTLTVDTHIKLQGDTSTAAHDYTGSDCVFGPTDSDGPDRVYEFTLQDAGSLKMMLERAPNSTLDPTLYWRSEAGCADEANAWGCWSYFPLREGMRQDVDPSKQVKPGIKIYVFVDGAGGTAGEYELSVSMEAAACGDGVTNTGEECDDGNNTDNDGCDKNCKLQTLSIFDDCNPGEPVVVQKNQPTIPDPYSSNTTGYADDYTVVADPQDCPWGGLAGGRDRVYQVVAADTGTLTATVGLDKDNTTDVCAEKTGADPGCWDFMLYARTGNCTDAEQIACSDGFFTPETLTFPVTGGQTYYIIVDGYFDNPISYGPYNLHLELN